MAFRKNDPRINRAGRPPGSKNQSHIKEAYRLLIENNLPKVEKWLNDVAENNPAKALEIILKLSEYILPKMKQAEIVEAIPEREPMTQNERLAEIAELKTALYEMDL